MPKLTHTDLRKLGQLLGYPLNDGGLCRGFSCMLMQAILAEEEAHFWQRLQLIEKYQSDFPLLQKEIENVRLKIKDKQQISSEEDRTLLEIPGLYEGVELYLNTSGYQDVFNKKNITQSSVDDIYRLAHPVKLKGDTISFPLDKEYACNKADLKNYINDLKEIFLKHPNLPILVDSSQHSVLLKYNSNNTKQPWLYVDTNDFQRYPDHPNYYRELNSTELVDSLFNSLSPTSEYIVFNMTVVANSTHPVNRDKSLDQFLVTYKLNKEQATIYDQDGEGLLFIACQNGHAEAVKLLLEQDGIEINKARTDGVTPLFMACQNGSAEVVKLLLDQKGIEINQARADGVTPLLMACQKGHAEVVKLLLALDGIKINKAKPNGVTPLFIACHKGHAEVVKLLLAQKGIKINKAKTDGVTPLFIACHNGHAEVVKLLLAQKGIDINKASTNGVTPLYIACRNGHAEVVKLLLAQDSIKINTADADGVTPLYMACENGYADVVKLLLDQGGIEINQASADGVTPLLMACENGHVEVVKLLLEQDGIEINKAKLNGVTPLYMACQNGYVEVVKLLLDQDGIEINKAKTDGVTPLYMACQNGYVEVVKLLLSQNGIDINKGMVGGYTPLFMACKNGHAEVVKLLLAQKGIEINKADADGDTPLFMACQNGHAEAIKLLLAQESIKINTANADGVTPLHAACLSPNTKKNNNLFDVLLKNNADPFLKNAKGETALDIAFSHENKTAIEALVLFAKDKHLSLFSFMSPETKDKALEWAHDKASKPHNNSFFASGSFSNSKDFIQQELQGKEGFVAKKL